MTLSEGPKKAIVVGASADIGMALCEDWLVKGWEVSGTYRTYSEAVRCLEPKLSSLVQCNLSNTDSVEDACLTLQRCASSWDVLVLSPGLQDPIGMFTQCDFEEWAQSIVINFTNQLRFTHHLLPDRNLNANASPTVIFFAGGGVNNAPIGYSAYTVSKIALMKMVELLAAEIPDVKFVIIGPGWVKTKIHNSILDAGIKAGDNYARTLEKFQKDEFTAMADVVTCCNALINGSKELLTGRNYSVVFDKWGSSELHELLAKHPDMYKLRRFGNDY